MEEEERASIIYLLIFCFAAKTLGGYGDDDCSIPQRLRSSANSARRVQIELFEIVNEKPLSATSAAAAAAAHRQLSKTMEQSDVETKNAPPR